MQRANAEHHVLIAFTALLLFFFGLTLFAASIVRASPAPAGAAGASTFKAKCVMCHGPDGGGSQIGKTMNVPDLRSAAVQTKSDAELAQIITDGKGGMPSFKGSLSEDQIHGLVTYVRSLAPKK